MHALAGFFVAAHCSVADFSQTLGLLVFLAASCLCATNGHEDVQYVAPPPPIMCPLLDDAVPLNIAKTLSLSAGIIASKRCNNAKIYGNTVYDGGAQAVGIFLHRSSDNAEIYGECAHQGRLWCGREEPGLKEEQEARYQRRGCFLRMYCAVGATSTSLAFSRKNVGLTIGLRLYEDYVWRVYTVCYLFFFLQTIRSTTCKTPASPTWSL